MRLFGGSHARRHSARAAVARGIDARLIEAHAVGDATQVEPCKAKFGSTPDLQECLLPNRRVEVELTAVVAR